MTDLVNKQWIIMLDKDKGNFEVLEYISYYDCLPDSGVGLNLISEYARKYGSYNILVVNKLPIEIKTSAQPTK